MVIHQKKIVHFFCIVLISALLAGCAGSVKNMRPIPAGMEVTQPDPGKSLVIFMRPSAMGFAIQSSVFEIKNDTPELVGIVAAKKKVAHQVDPGEHLFMVVGESGDFMSAELLPDKTYYALVTPRMGVWKARFSLKPIRKSDADSAKFNNWVKDCQAVEKSEESKKWAKNNAASITSKYKEYYEKWSAKEESAQPKLLPEDGM